MSRTECCTITETQTLIAHSGIEPKTMLKLLKLPKHKVGAHVMAIALHMRKVNALEPWQNC